MNKIIWFTGPPCSGKTTIAEALYKELESAKHLDGDNVRNVSKAQGKEIGFSKEERFRHIMNVALKAHAYSNTFKYVLCSFITPYRSMRKMLRNAFGDKLVIVLIECEMSTCVERDTKGMYEKALAGKIKNFTGIDDPYEYPSTPDIELNTDILNVEECVDLLLRFLNESGQHRDNTKTKV